MLASDDDEGDYGRTKRQQQVMSAVLEQVKINKLFTGSGGTWKSLLHDLNKSTIWLLVDPMGFICLEGAQNGTERLTVPELGI